eukprot:COSAG02_NODE_2286_length_9213_cov_149.155914_10_plen_145_part_00
MPCARCARESFKLLPKFKRVGYHARGACACGACVHVTMCACVCACEVGSCRRPTWRASCATPTHAAAMTSARDNDQPMDTLPPEQHTIHRLMDTDTANPRYPGSHYIKQHALVVTRRKMIPMVHGSAQSSSTKILELDWAAISS